MKLRLSDILSLVVALALLLPAGGMTASAQDRSATPEPAALQRVPIMFIENVGQFADGARFQIPSGDRTHWLAEDALWVTVWEQTDAGTPATRVEGGVTTSQEAPTPRSVKGVNLRLSFIGANPHPRIEPFDRLDTHVSYFIGNDPEEWHPDVPVWGGVRYVDLYPGIDLEITGKNDRVVQRFIARSGADLRVVRLQVDGAEGLTLEGDALGLTTDVGDSTLPFFQAAGAVDTDLAYPAISGDQVVLPFATGSTHPQFLSNEQPGASDLLYSTFLGGFSSDEGLAIEVDGSGNVYVAGSTLSTDFPTSPGAFDTTYSIWDDHDAFVAKLTPSGESLVYATYLGGSEDECNLGGYPFVYCSLSVDGSGYAYIAGLTGSPDFPTTPGALDTTLGGSTDAFVTKLNPTGTALIYSTYLGGTYRESCHSLAVDSNGNAYVAGTTESPDFPATPGAYDASSNGSGDAFIAKLNSAGSGLLYATFLGASDIDGASAIAVDEGGDVYVAGWTWSSDFPTTPGAYDTTCGWLDAFVAKFDSTGSALLYCTCLGGVDHDWGREIAVDGNGNTYVAGDTESADFPITPGALDDTLDGSKDIFVAKLNPAGSDLLYSTFLGGSAHEEAHALAVDTSGNAHLTGYTSSSDFPTTASAFDTIHAGYSDAFVTKLNSSGSALVYSTFLGGSEGTSQDEYGYGIALSDAGTAYVTGGTRASDFPTTPDAYDTTLGFSGGDAFVAKLRLPSPNVDTYVDAPMLVSTHPDGVATAPVEYGNRGATTATSVTLVATLSSGLTYVSDTSGIAPGLGNNTVTWNLPALAFRESGGFALRVGLDGTAAIGTRYPLTLAISSAGTEDNPSDNTTIIEVMAAQPTYLPIILLNH